MLSLEESSKILTVIEEAIICWARLYPDFSNSSSIEDLINGKFFLELVKIIPNFKFV